MILLGLAHAGNAEAWAAYDKACDLGHEPACTLATHAAPEGVCASAWVELGEGVRLSFGGPAIEYASDDEALEVLTGALVCPATPVRLVARGDYGRWFDFAHALDAHGASVQAVEDFSPVPPPDHAEIPPPSDCATVNACVEEAGAALGIDGWMLGWGIDKPVSASGTEDVGTLMIPGLMKAHDVVLEHDGRTLELVADPRRKGTLDKDAVHAVIQAEMGAIRGCYQSELHAGPALSGKVVVKFVIELDGTVTGARVIESTLHSDTVEACILEVFAAMRFPEPENGVVLVSFPFVFTPE